MSTSVAPGLASNRLGSTSRGSATYFRGHSPNTGPGQSPSTIERAVNEHKPSLTRDLIYAAIALGVILLVLVVVLVYGQTIPTDL